jgi:hypothetical protein
MNRLYIPTLGPSDWRRLLADPKKQWRQQKSAYESAVAWEAARHTVRGLPAELLALFDTNDSWGGASLLLALPEHQVELEGGGHSYQTDLWALIASPGGVASVALEAKAGESFDQPVASWLEKASAASGKPARLTQLCEILELDREVALTMRYQLMHRSAASLLEARRFCVPRALFLVHAFGDNADSLRDYQRWADALGVMAEADQLHRVGVRHGVDFWIGWAGAGMATHSVVRAAV